VRRRLERGLVVAGHFGWPVPLVAVAGVRLTGQLVELAWLGLAGVSMTVWLWHLWGICPACARRMPALPGREAERRARVLDWVHSWWRRPVTWVVVAGDLVLNQVLGDWWTVCPAVTMVVATAAGMWALDWHARLAPWCPRCPGGGLGDGVCRPRPAGLGGGQR
jgi:hypothetical protein